MRTFIAFLLVILLGIFCFISNDAMFKTASKTEEYIDDAKTAVKNGNFDLAKENYEKAKKYWEKREKILVFFISHSTLDDITLSLGKIDPAIKKGEETLFFYQTAELNILLDKIKNINSLSLKHLV
jgi:hypothetical protein